MANVVVRYTGRRPGSSWYSAPGASKRYAFGMNPFHAQQIMPESDYDALKAVYKRDLLKIPMSLSSEDVGIYALVSVEPSLAEGDRFTLSNAGFVTVGQVMAVGAAGLMRSLGSIEKAELVVATLLGAYLNGGDIPVAESEDQEIPSDDLTALPRVGEATQSALNGMGYYTYGDIAVRLTEEDWLSMSGKTTSGYNEVIAAAGRLVK